jgi:hypothetical protein
MYWFAWYTFHPDTKLLSNWYRNKGIN